MKDEATGLVPCTECGNDDGVRHGLCSDCLERLCSTRDDERAFVTVPPQVWQAAAERPECPESPNGRHLAVRDTVLGDECLWCMCGEPEQADMEQAS